MTAFYLLYTAQMISLGGTVLNSVVSMFWVYSLTGSVSGSILSGFFPLAVYFPVSFFAAALVDRGSKKKYVLAGEAAQALVFVAFFLMAKHGVKNIYAVYFLQGVLGLASAFFSPAIAAWEMSYIRQVYQKMAGTMHVAASTLNLAFTLLGGLLAARVPFHYIFLVNAASFAVAFAIEAFLSEPAAQPARPAVDGPGRLIPEMKAGLVYIIAEKPVVLFSVALLALMNMFFAPLANMLPVFIKVGLNLGPDAFSFAMIAGMLGSMAAGFGIRKIGKLSPKSLLALCVADSALCLATYFVSGLAALLIVMVAVGFIVNLVTIAIKVEVSTVEPHYYCKVQSLSENISGVLVPAGIVLMSVLAGVGGVRLPFLFSGLALLLVAGSFAWILGRRNFDARSGLGIAAAEGAR